MPVEAALLRAFDDCAGSTNGPPQVSGQLITCRAWKYPIAPVVSRFRQSPARLRPPLFGGGKRIPKVTSKLVLRLGMCNEGEPDRRPFRISLTTEPRPL
jgi:hypothetical protein